MKKEFVVLGPTADITACIGRNVGNPNGLVLVGFVRQACRISTTSPMRWCASDGGRGGPAMNA